MVRTARSWLMAMLTGCRGLARCRARIRSTAYCPASECRRRIDRTPRIAAVLPMTRQAVRNLARRYQQGGLERALYDKQRPGAARLLSVKQRQRIITMVCSDPPRGRARWTVRLVAEEAVKRRLVPRVGPEPEFASWAAICDGMKWPPAGSSLLTSRFGASSRHFSLLQKRILSMKRHRDEHDLGERWSWTHDEFDLLRNRTDSGPITT